MATVVLVGSIGGAVLAADDGDDTRVEDKSAVLLDRVCAIYQEKTGVTIDQEALKDAFAEAQDEMRSEALRTWLQSLVDEDRITQAEADEYLQWMEVKPDMPAGFGLRGRGGFRGMGDCRGWGRMGTSAQ